MKMLHIVNKSPFENTSLDSCLRMVSKDCALLLIEDAVYAVAKHNALEEKMKQTLKTVKIYALWPDLEARGMQDAILDGVKLVGYDGFVDLVAEHDSVQSWL